ncbi:hypothetical protein MLD38_000025 [Melastoma candidum]|uniref:Uncharacterized protein n=1 Tax=Melastoma candidum TaxID=119954 RepID=A0ACB9SCP0_9MYRT|nr:hypothetical protein MLD38_000025 [Melastoma candidum]
MDHSREYILFLFSLVKYFTVAAFLTSKSILKQAQNDNWQKIGEAEREREKNVDYLSSIEVLIIDYVDVIAMQNWAHVKTVVEQLNQLPSKQHGTDVMRVRPWYLDGNARFYRQSIVLGHYLKPGSLNLLVCCFISKSYIL